MFSSGGGCGEGEGALLNVEAAETGAAAVCDVEREGRHCSF